MNDKFNILVIEDDHQNFAQIQAALTDTNYQISRAMDGKEALQLAKEWYFAAVIMELHLPDTEGVELIRKLKKIDFRINVVILTAYNFISAAVEALKKGAFAYLLKPLIPDEIKLVITRAIENSFLVLQARRIRYYHDISILDGLTGIYNHRHFHEVLNWQITHLRRSPQTISLFIVDIDNFKAFNDTKGHVEGDKVLRNTAQLMANLTRETDFVFRYGGEEFSIILPQTTKKDARLVGGRLVEIVRVQLPISVSVGLAAFPEHAQNKDELVVKADRALYRAKKMGKNQICEYDENLDK